MELKELQETCKRMLELRSEIARLEDEKKVLNEELTRLKAETVEHLDQHGIKSFNFGEGKVSITERRSVRILDKYKFFDWLKARGTFEELASVHAQTVTKIYNTELEAAQESGDIEFLEKGIDGLSEPTTFRDIRFLK